MWIEGENDEVDDDVVEGEVDDDESVEDDEGQSVEDRARQMGWKPKDEFSGPEDKWVSAEEFVRVGDEALPVLRERLRMMNSRDVKNQKQIDNLTQQISQLTETMTEFRDHARRSEERAFERAKKQIEADMDRAAEEGDMDEYKAKKQKLSEISAQEAQKKTAAAEKGKEQKPEGGEELPASVREFIKENSSWWEKDIVLTNTAIAMHQENLDSGMSEDESMEVLRDQLEETMPSRFKGKTKTRRRRNAVGESTLSRGGSPKGGKHTYENLPREAKEACDRFVRDIPGYTREEYLKEFDWEGAA